MDNGKLSDLIFQITNRAVASGPKNNQVPRFVLQQALFIFIACRNNKTMQYVFTIILFIIHDIDIQAV